MPVYQFKPQKLTMVDNLVTIVTTITMGTTVTRVTTVTMITTLTTRHGNPGYVPVKQAQPPVERV